MFQFSGFICTIGFGVYETANLVNTQQYLLKLKHTTKFVVWIKSAFISGEMGTKMTELHFCIYAFLATEPAQNLSH